MSAKVHSIPSLLAWMREKPAGSTAIGDGELVSHVAWKKGEINFSDARFALEHASGQGQAVVTLQSPRPHMRAALALDRLDLNPFLARAADEPQPRRDPWPAARRRRRRFARIVDIRGRKPALAPRSNLPLTRAAPSPDACPCPRSKRSAASPVAATRLLRCRRQSQRAQDARGHLDIGPSSIGFAFRDGVLNAMLGGMELYDGQGSGKLVVDATKPVPGIHRQFPLDGVQAKALL